ncbi:efflux RND transporter periplasmic adaptor subunit [Dickeya solani]|uniref:Efflux RND transporter periplasmic adaptor subunit n=1 Tax=Dickeya solani TaxID=1089444 RepID=A0AAX4EW72_9GAMM|nr:HlyD family efflux transporter periplasmic adaptor subunit [Dickeya solani]MCA6998235.1 efflux RND transporter periplasmic adaptor subunit [Dickeya solani]MCZ0783243.1 efflux RND transporter periplasmic adaptor subunit [Dickeya solani]MCZ0789837.1 efflux RND transporter periplasmic adaptor subunit [Dickeya solani]MCZ0798740.1 efflux RND transporter periplasmic adaptor subunit [Dickeya solani]MCZ0803273.1 efflux RND transporter periplasmic adaptor subunit [Dickeya solani]
MDTTSTPSAPRASHRKRHFAILLLVLLLGAAGGVAYYQIYLRFYETTDNAYVGGNLITLTPQVGGTVTQVSVDDGDYVEKGQLLVQLSPSDTLIALQQSEAQLASAVRQVRGLYSTVDNYQAQVASRQVALQQAIGDYNRRKGLMAKGAISAEDLAHYQDAVNSARSALDAAEQALRTNQAMVDNTVLDDHPEIKNAVADLRSKYLDWARSAIVAPVSGYVAKRAVQVGMRVSSGATLMTIVPLDQVWVDANFKESQMVQMRLGQPVTLTADIYGDKTVYHGTIQSLGIGTGSAFSLLPAQNASGNWIKIVQRLPVRIALDPEGLKQRPLRIGLSMLASVDLHNTQGELLPVAPVSAPRYLTDVYDDPLLQADKLVAKILSDNSQPRTSSRG